MGDNFITNCKNLKSITFRNNEINGFPTCYGCPKFKELKLDGNEDKYKIENNILYTADGKKLIFCPYGKAEDIIIPNYVETIGNYSFFAANVKTITIPDSVIKIGNGAFQSSAIESIIIGKNVKQIGGNAFLNCRKLKKVTINSDIVAGATNNSCYLLENRETIYIYSYITEIGSYITDNYGVTTNDKEGYVKYIKK